MTPDLGLLSELPPAEQRAVISRMHRHTYGAGEIICHEGDPADTMHFVVEGRVVARRASEAGDVHAYSLMGPGQAFGELAMIRRGGRRTVTIEAIERTVTMTLAYADFERLCAGHPEVNRLLLRLLVARVDRLTDALMEALHAPAEQRVLRRLVNLCGMYSTAGTKKFTGHGVAQPDRSGRARRRHASDRQPRAAAPRGRGCRRAPPGPHHGARRAGTPARGGHAEPTQPPVSDWVGQGVEVTSGRRSAAR